MTQVELQEAGFSEQEIQGYNLKQAGFSDNEINQYFTKPSLWQRSKEAASGLAENVVEGYRGIFTATPEISTQPAEPTSQMRELQSLSGTDVRGFIPREINPKVSHPEGMEGGGIPSIKREAEISTLTPEKEALSRPLTGQEKEYLRQRQDRGVNKKEEYMMDMLGLATASMIMPGLALPKGVLTSVPSLKILLNQMISGGKTFGLNSIVKNVAKYTHGEEEDVTKLVKDTLVETGFGAGLGGIFAIPSAIRSSNWWRLLDNPERNLIVQSIDELKRAGFRDAEIARMRPDFFKQELAKRSKREMPITPTATVTAEVPKPTEIPKTTELTLEQASKLTKPEDVFTPLPVDTVKELWTIADRLKEGDKTALEDVKTMLEKHKQEDVAHVINTRIATQTEGYKSLESELQGLLREKQPPTQPAPSVPAVDEALIQEAKGYKTAEEFVESKNKNISSVARTVLEPPNSVLSGFAHGKEKIINTVQNLSTFKNKAINASILQNEQGKYRVVLHGEDLSFIDAGALLRKEGNGFVIENIANNETINNAIPLLKKVIKDNLGNIIIDKNAPRILSKSQLTDIWNKAQEPAPSVHSKDKLVGMVMPLRYDAGDIPIELKPIATEKGLKNIDLESYNEPLGGEGGFISIGKDGETNLDLSQIADRDISYSDWLRVSPHVADRHPYMKAPIYTAITAEQEITHLIQTATERVTQLFDKIEPLGILGKIVDRRGSNLEGIQDMIKGKVPVPEKLKPLVTEIKNILEDYREKIIEYKREKVTSHLSPKQKEYLDFIEGKTTERPKYVRKGTVNAVNQIMEEYKNLEAWGQTDYFPEVFKGQYKIVHAETGSIIGSGESAKQAKLNALANIEEQHPEWAKDKFIATNDFIDLLTLRKALNPKLAGSLRYLGTSLSRKEYGTLIGKITKKIKDELPDLKTSEINIDLSGIARIKPSAKWSGHLMEKKTNLKGDYQDPYRQLISYIVSIERKLAIEPAKKALYDYADKLSPMMTNAKQYIKDMADDLAGRYDIANKIIDGVIGRRLGAKPFLLSRWLSRGTSLEAKLKLGYAPVKAKINRLGGFAHTAIKEGIGYTVKGRLAIRTPEGKAVIESIRQRIGMEQPFTTGGVESFKAVTTMPLRPLGWYNKQELINRPEAFMATYLRAIDKGLSKEKAIDMAVETAQLTQGLYNTMALPAMIRKLGAVGKAGFQFKQYVGNEWRFMASLTPGQWAKYIPYIITMGGTRGTWLTLKSIIGIGIIGIGLDELADRMNKKAPHLHRGVFGLTGFDVSAPATWQVPSRISDWIAPLYKDSYNTGKMIMEGLKNNGWTDEEVNDYFQSLAPVTYNFWQGIEMLTTGEIKEGTKTIYKGEKKEGIINLLGARTVEQSQASDLARHELQLKTRQNKLIDIEMDTFFKAADKNDEKAINRSLTNLVKLKGIQTPEETQTLRNSLINSWKERQLTQQQRVFKGLPKNLKREEFKELSQ